MKKKTVVIGGGNGSAISAQALKKNLELFDIEIIVAISDSGGSTGKLREEFGVIPPGDILRAILSLSEYDYKMLKVIFHRIRFENAGKLDNHNLGNLFLVLANQYGGDFMQAVRALEQAVKAQGKAYPISLNSSDLVAELNNGEMIRTEGQIDRPKSREKNMINKVYLDPEVEIYKDARESIENADYILIGPGSLYCSIIATLLPKGTKEAIAKSKAKIIYVAGNAYEEKGENGPTVLSEYIKQLEQYLPRKIDLVIFNNAKLDSKQQAKYDRKEWRTIEFDKENLGEYDIVTEDYETSTGGISKSKLGDIFKKVLK